MIKEYEWLAVTFDRQRQDMKLSRRLLESMVVIFHNPETEKCAKKEQTNIWNYPKMLMPILKHPMFLLLGPVPSQKEFRGTKWRPSKLAQSAWFPRLWSRPAHWEGICQDSWEGKSLFCLERVVLTKIFSPPRLGRRRRFGSIADRSLLHMSMEFQSLLGDHLHICIYMTFIMI